MSAYTVISCTDFQLSFNFDLKPWNALLSICARKRILKRSIEPFSSNHISLWALPTSFWPEARFLYICKKAHSQTENKTYLRIYFTSSTQKLASATAWSEAKNSQKQRLVKLVCDVTETNSYHKKILIAQLYLIFIICQKNH